VTAAPEAAPGRTGRVRAGLLLLCILAACVVFLSPALRPGRMLWGLDFCQHKYWRAFGYGALRQGHFPLWNPYAFCGMPFAAKMQAALFYPPNVVFLFLPVDTALDTSVLLHFCLSAVTMWWLARRLGADPLGAAVASVVFAFGHFQVTRLAAGHLDMLCSLPWVPLVFLAGEDAASGAYRRAFFTGALALACQALAGSPGLVWITVQGCAVYVAARTLARPRDLLRAFGVLAAAGVTAALLAGVQLAPAAGLAALSPRAGGLSPDAVTSFSMPPRNLVSIVLPHALGDAVTVPYGGEWNLWESTAYVGILPLLLAAAAVALRAGPRATAFAATAGVGLLLALGRYLPGYAWLATLPVQNLFRAPGRYALLFGTGAAVAAGLGVTACLRAAGSRRMRRVATGAAAAGCVAVVALGAASLWSGRMAEGARGSAAAALDLWGWGLLKTTALTLAGGLVCAGFAWRRAARVSAWAALLLVGADLGHHGFRYVQTAAPGDVCLAGGVRRHLLPAAETWRVVVEGDLFRNCGMEHKILFPDGFDPDGVRRYHELVNVGRGRAPDALRVFMRLTADNAFCRLLGVRFIVATRPPPLPYRPVGRGRWSRHVFEARDVFPRAMIVPRARAVFDAARVRAAMLAPGFDPSAEVLLEEAPPAAGGGRGTALPRQRGPNVLEVRTDTDGPAYLVVSDVWTPGWRARLDGVPAPLLRANYAFRAVAVPAGVHTVVMEYAPSGIRWGAGASAAGVLLLGGVAAATRRSRRLFSKK
jgi:hypothetical protein